jgi:release factor glutamine methyltransferase
VNIGDFLATTTTRLSETSTTPRLDAELLLGHVLGWSRAKLLAERDHEITAEARKNVEVLVERRLALEPISYLIGSKGFSGLDFYVDQRVLIPRPETELLVELTLASSNAKRKAHNAKCMVADIGTGSGAIAVALATHLPNAHIYAIDISADALEVAARNVARYGLEQRITLLQGDLLGPLPEPVDLLVSNPPYTILAEVEPNVYRHEPHLALDGGAEGMEIYQRLVQSAPAYLKKGATILLEIGAWQGAAVKALSQNVFPEAMIQVHQDFAGHDRVVVIETEPKI